MARSRFAALLLAVSFVTASSFARPVAEHHGSAMAVSGAYAITFNLTIASTLPANSTIVCKAQAAPANSNLEGFNAQVAAPVESASGVATVSGSTATCAVEIPFSWTVETTRQGVALSYEIDAINPSGALPTVVRTSVQQGMVESYPSTGGTASVAVNVTF